MKKIIVAGVIGIGFMAGGLRSEAQQQPMNMEDLQKGLASMMQAMSSGTTNATMVDFRELKALLPASLPNMKRTAAKGEKSGAMGMSISQATGEYANEAGGSVTIEIQDLSGTAMVGLLAMGFEAEVESESDDGYEKTYTYKQHKVQEEYNTTDKYGELKLLVAKRIIVNISVNGVEADVMKTALDAIDLAKLNALATSAAGTSN